MLNLSLCSGKKKPNRSSTQDTEQHRGQYLLIRKMSSGSPHSSHASIEKKPTTHSDASRLGPGGAGRGGGRVHGFVLHSERVPFNTVKGVRVSGHEEGKGEEEEDEDERDDKNMDPSLIWELLKQSAHIQQQRVHEEVLAATLSDEHHHSEDTVSSSLPISRTSTATVIPLPMRRDEVSSASLLVVPGRDSVRPVHESTKVKRRIEASGHDDEGTYDIKTSCRFFLTKAGCKSAAIRTVLKSAGTSNIRKDPGHPAAAVTIPDHRQECAWMHHESIRKVLVDQLGLYLCVNFHMCGSATRNLRCPPCHTLYCKTRFMCRHSPDCNMPVAIDNSMCSRCASGKSDRCASCISGRSERSQRLQHITPTPPTSSSTSDDDQEDLKGLRKPTPALAAAAVAVAVTPERGNPPKVNAGDKTLVILPLSLPHVRPESDGITSLPKKPATTRGTDTKAIRPLRANAHSSTHRVL